MLRSALQRWRENYYVSKVLVSLSRPAYACASVLAREIPRKVKNNGANIRLPNGRKLIFNKDSGVAIGSLLYWQGLDGYEASTSKTLRYFFERVSSFVDVGANYGLYSLVAALYNPKIQVTAFEPEPRIYDQLVKNIQLNHIANQITAHKLAVSDKSGKTEFYLPPTSTNDIESTGTIARESWQNQKEHTTLEVDSIRFDDFAKNQTSRVELVKIDVEDAEANVLCGMAETIRRDQPVIICEILPRAHKNEKTLRIVQELGYTPYWITSEGYIRVPNFDFDRKSSQDFLLSPKLTDSTVVSNPDEFLPTKKN